MKIKTILKRAFLPRGYPKTVSDDYLEYQFWDSIQAFASGIMGYLSTQAVFRGVGVGDQNATVLAATMTWILKDGFSMIGSLIFATIQCTKMDSYCKRWRLFADLTNDIAISLDLLSPVFSGWFFLACQCLSGTMKSLVGIAGGATRAALTQHQAKANNLADVSAKDNSQERLVNLTSLLFSLILMPLVSENQILVWSFFILFALIHFFANYRAIRSVRIDVFNAARLSIFLENFFLQKPLDVASVNAQENVWFFQVNDPNDKMFDSITFDVDEHCKDLFGIRLTNKQSNELTFVVKESSHSQAILHALCFHYCKLHKKDPAKNIPEILEAMKQNHWNTSHVLIQELFLESDEDNNKKQL